MSEIFQCPSCRATFHKKVSKCPKCGIGFIGEKKIKRLLPSIEDDQINNLFSLFNEKKYGLNILVGIGYLIASIFSLFIPELMNVLQKVKVSFPPFNYYLPIFLILFISSVIFVIIIHKVHKILWAAIYFGLGIVLTRIIIVLIFNSDKQFFIENYFYQSKFFPYF